MTDPAAPAPSHPSAEEGPRAPGSPPAGAPVPPPAPPVAPYGLAPAPVPPTPAVIPWGQPVYAAAPPKGLSITSMVLGLVSLVLFWTVVCPIVGLILGIVGVRKEPAGRGFAITGLVLNGLLLLIPVAVILFLLAAGTTVAGVAATSGP
ncbi:DUF4190 domain-containing protein [Clavibacter zhangzhiyongii]|uniref:DUF4190 domain-containing protein n=1 Tax=Clavibacter zhangzhiyongii TaxID=2768071 RepID=UPI0039E0BE84